MQALNFVRGSEILLFFRAINNVRILFAQQRAIRRNDNDFEPVDLVKFGSFGFRRARHARQLLIHAEIILEGDRGKRLILALDLDVLFRFNRLVQTVGPAPTRHQASGELVDDQHFAIFHHVLDVFLVKRMRFDGGFDVMFQRPVFRIGDVADAQQLFNLLPAVVAYCNVAVFFVDHIVAGKNLRFTLARISLLAQF